MKPLRPRMLIATAALLSVLFTLTSCSRPHEPRLSIFADHIATIAQQEHISYAEAATRVRDMGYMGVDVSTTIPARQLRTLDSLGFAHACAIAWIDFVAGPQDKAEEQALTFMEQSGWKRVLLVPGFLPGNQPSETADSLRDAAIGRIAAFAKRASERGLEVLVEDFDNPRSLCYDTPSLDRLFAASPELGHVFDTGNYVFSGEDVIAALNHFMPRIHHVHLKDRLAPHDGHSPAIGKGIVPFGQIIGQLRASNYDGWLTVEHYGSSDMLNDAAFSAQFLRNIHAADAKR